MRTRSCQSRRTVLLDVVIIPLPFGSPNKVSVKSCRLVRVVEGAGEFHHLDGFQLDAVDGSHLVFAAGFGRLAPVDTRKLTVCFVNERRLVFFANLRCSVWKSGEIGVSDVAVVATCLSTSTGVVVAGYSKLPK